MCLLLRETRDLIKEAMTQCPLLVMVTPPDGQGPFMASLLGSQPL